MEPSRAPQRPAGGALTARVVSAALLLPLLSLAVWFGGVWFALVVTVAALLGLAEFYHLAQSTGSRPYWPLGLAWTAAIIATAAGFGLSAALAATVIGLFAILLWMVARRRVPGALVDWAFTVAGPAYLGLTLLHAILLRQGSNGREWVFLALAGTFATDTAAYFIGRVVGRHKMAPSISPGKTWEGAVGGLAGAGAAPALAAWPQGLPVPVWQMVLLGVAIGVVAQVGDLAESLFKRAAGAKEASRLIPGHGGILDRLDSLVFTIVVVYYFVRGVVS